MAPTHSSSSGIAKRGRSGGSRGRGRGRGAYWQGSWRDRSSSAASSRVNSRAPSTRASATPGPGHLDIHAVPGSTRSRASTATPAPQHVRFRSSRSVATESTVGAQSEAETETVQRDEDDDALNEVVMAVDMRSHGTVGCAYYIARDEVLYLMQDAQLGGKDLIDQRKSCCPR